ncbi:unnamed protein product [Blepharisma stoltei]|uniref:Uncharacterized protein n=1 Tax=Blepharisma stoltei TaxID=1481888 RepID=A0AAU9J4S3_9CILI|nr:unnamed protein product [Blepharisma stoltei]
MPYKINTYFAVMAKCVYDGEQLGDGEMQMVSWRYAGEIEGDSWIQSGITEHVLQFVSLWGNEFFWDFIRIRILHQNQLHFILSEFKFQIRISYNREWSDWKILWP